MICHDLPIKNKFAIGKSEEHWECARGGDHDFKRVSDKDTTNPHHRHQIHVYEGWRKNSELSHSRPLPPIALLHEKAKRRKKKEKMTKKTTTGMKHTRTRET